jgi:hypothetical protein
VYCSLAVVWLPRLASLSNSGRVDSASGPDVETDQPLVKERPAGAGSRPMVPAVFRTRTTVTFGPVTTALPPAQWR